MLVYLNQISFLFLDCIIFSKSVYHQYYLIPYKWRQWYILDLWAHLIVIKMQFCRLDIFFPSEVSIIIWYFYVVPWIRLALGATSLLWPYMHLWGRRLYATHWTRCLSLSLSQILYALLCFQVAHYWVFFYIICQKRINYDNLGEDSGKGGQIFCWHIYGYEHAGRDIWYVNILHNIFKLTWNAKPWDNQIQQKIGKKKREKERPYVIRFTTILPLRCS